MRNTGRLSLIYASQLEDRDSDGGIDMATEAQIVDAIHQFFGPIAGEWTKRLAEIGVMILRYYEQPPCEEHMS